MIFLLCIITIYSHFSSSFFVKVAITAEKICATLDFVFWFFFFYVLNKSGPTKMKYLIVIMSFITLITMIVINAFATLTFISLGLSNFTKCLFCLIYFHNLFSSPPTIILRKEPVFWIVTGLFLYTASSLPIYVSTVYLNTIETGKALVIFAFTNIAIVIMHFFFIKAHLCVRLYPKTLLS